MQLITGHFEADGAIIYLPIGFVPDYFYMVDMVTDGESIHYEWWRDMADVDATYGGGLTEDDDGVNAWIATAAGITTYNTGTQGPTILDYTTVNADAATARTATVRGTLLRPSATGTTIDGLTADRSMVFECVTAGTSTAEPSWPVGIGDQVTDGTNVYELVNQATFRYGYQGLTIAGDIQTNGQECFFNAFQADQYVDHLDVDSWAGGIYGS